jgi:RHS repeat-associated protein
MRTECHENNDTNFANLMAHSSLSVANYKAKVITASDYYSFGSIMENRYYEADTNGYRFGFNSKEKDDEIWGIGKGHSYEYRIYNADYGRFLSVDPMFRVFPRNSPYAYAENSPIAYVDAVGLQQVYFMITNNLMGSNPPIKISFEAHIDIEKQNVLYHGLIKIDNKTAQAIGLVDFSEKTGIMNPDKPILEKIIESIPITTTSNDKIIPMSDRWTNYKGFAPVALWLAESAAKTALGQVLKENEGLKKVLGGSVDEIWKTFEENGGRIFFKSEEVMTVTKKDCCGNKKEVTLHQVTYRIYMNVNIDGVETAIIFDYVDDSEVKEYMKNVNKENPQ